MRVFVTGASGFVGSAVIAELLAAGHDVTGLARSADTAQTLHDMGVTVFRGDLNNPDSLQPATEKADGVIHLAYHHVFTEYDRAAYLDSHAIGVLGDALADSDRPLIVASGMAIAGSDDVLTESDATPADSPRKSEVAALAFAERGVRVIGMRLAPTVHGIGDQGFVARLVQIARETGVSGYPEDGTNRWPAVHRLDAARLLRLALEDPDNAPAGSVFHAAAEEGIPTRAIAETIGAGLGLPVASVRPAHFGWLGRFFSQDMAASSAQTRQALGWTPTEVGLLDDLAAGHYFAS